MLALSPRCLGLAAYVITLFCLTGCAVPLASTDQAIDKTATRDAAESKVPKSSVQLSSHFNEMGKEGASKFQGRPIPFGATKVGPGLLLTHANALLRVLRNAAVHDTSGRWGMPPEAEQFTSAMADHMAGQKDLGFSLLPIGHGVSKTIYVREVLLPSRTRRFGSGQGADSSRVRLSSDIVLLKVQVNVIDHAEPDGLRDLPAATVLLTRPTDRPSPLGVVQEMPSLMSCLGLAQNKLGLRQHSVHDLPDLLRTHRTGWFAPTRGQQAAALRRFASQVYLTPLANAPVRRPGYLGNRLTESDIGSGVFLDPAFVDAAFVDTAATNENQTPLLVAVNAGPLLIPNAVFGRDGVEVAGDSLLAGAITHANVHERIAASEVEHLVDWLTFHNVRVLTASNVID